MKSMGKEVKGMFGERINDETEGECFIFKQKMHNKLYSLTLQNTIRFSLFLIFQCQNFNSTEVVSSIHMGL